MNSSLKTVGLLAGVVLLVGGLTYMLQYSVSPNTTGPTPVIPPPPPALTFPVKAVESGTETGAEFEVNSEGHHDFWFHNAENAAVSVGLADKNCACARVELCQLTPEESRRFL